MLLMSPDVGGGDVAKVILSTICGGVGGFATALFTFKMKIAMLERDLSEHKASVNVKMDQHTKILEQVNRRQLVTLEALFDIANAISEKLGVTNKSSHVLMKFIHESAAEG